MKIINKLLAFLAWFNGKKTVIGGLLMAIEFYTRQWLVVLNHYDPPWLEKILMNVAFFGSALLGVGVAHKISKGEMSFKKQDVKPSEPPTE